MSWSAALSSTSPPFVSGSSMIVAGTSNRPRFSFALGFHRGAQVFTGALSEMFLA